MNSKKFNKVLIKLLESNYLVLIPICIHILLFVPYINSIPYLDGNIDFVKSVNFYEAGLSQYISAFGSSHPPIKFFVISLLFKITGPNIIVYNLFGILISVSGVLGIYLLVKRLFNNKTGIVSAILLSIFPLYLATSLFSLIDLLVTVGIIWSLYLYSAKKYFCLLIVLTITCLVKEVALLFPIAIIITEITYVIKDFVYTKKIKFKNEFELLIIAIIQFVIFGLWSEILKLNESTIWNDWIFTETGNSALATIINNILTLGFFNEYFIQNILQLLFLNWNWIYWCVIFIGSIKLLWDLSSYQKKRITNKISKGDTKFRTLLILTLFSIMFIPSVLGFQTYTIPRYALPLTPLIIISTSYIISKYTNLSRLKSYLFLLPFFTIIITSVISSIDPISSSLWGKTEIEGYEFYKINESLAGNDGLTYNHQFIRFSKYRTDLLKRSDQIISDDCFFIYADVNNDAITFEALEIAFSECKSSD